jgi:hypothetical protein
MFAATTYTAVAAFLAGCLVCLSLHLAKPHRLEQAKELPLAQFPIPVFISIFKLAIDQRRNEITPKCRRHTNNTKKVEGTRKGPGEVYGRGRTSDLLKSSSLNSSASISRQNSLISSRSSDLLSSVSYLFQPRQCGQ